VAGEGVKEDLQIGRCDKHRRKKGVHVCHIIAPMYSRPFPLHTHTHKHKHTHLHQRVVANKDAVGSGYNLVFFCV
jgi:hypothetical protein